MWAWAPGRTPGTPTWEAEQKCYHSQIITIITTASDRDFTSFPNPVSGILKINFTTGNILWTLF